MNKQLLLEWADGLQKLTSEEYTFDISNILKNLSEVLSKTQKPCGCAYGALPLIFPEKYNYTEKSWHCVSLINSKEDYSSFDTDSPDDAIEFNAPEGVEYEFIIQEFDLTKKEAEFLYEKILIMRSFERDEFSIYEEKYLDEITAKSVADKIRKFVAGEYNIEES